MVTFKIFKKQAGLNSSTSLDSTIKQVKFKHNNVFMNKLVNMRVRFNHI